MIAASRLFWIEARRNTAIWFAPVVLAITWYIGSRQHAAEVTLWSTTSAQLGQALIVLGPLVGGLAAWVASRDKRRGTEDLIATMPRSQVTRDLLGYGSTVGWALLAYLATVVIVFITTYRAATWGSPDLLPIAATMATIAFAAAAGYAAGLYVPSRFTPALVAIALVLALVVPMSGASQGIEDEQKLYLDYESPIRNFTPFNYVNPGEYDPFYDVWPSVALPLITWLLAITGIVLAGMALYRRRSEAIWTALLISLLGASTSGAALYGKIEYRALEPGADDTQLVCQDGRVTVCVHPVYEAILDDAAIVVHRLTEPVAGLPGVPSRVEQAGQGLGFPASDPPPGTLQYHFYNWIYNGSFGRAEDAEAIVRQVICESACRVFWESGYRFGDPARTVIGTWLLEQAGIELRPLPPVETGSEAAQSQVAVAVDRFAALEPTERRAWFERHFADLRTGRLTMDDLP